MFDFEMAGRKNLDKVWNRHRHYPVYPGNLMLVRISECVQHPKTLQVLPRNNSSVK